MVLSGGMVALTTNKEIMFPTFSAFLDNLSPRRTDFLRPEYMVFPPVAERLVGTDPLTTSKITKGVSGVEKLDGGTEEGMNLAYRLVGVGLWLLFLLIVPRRQWRALYQPFFSRPYWRSLLICWGWYMANGNTSGRRLAG